MVTENLKLMFSAVIPPEQFFKPEEIQVALKYNAIVESADGFEYTEAFWARLNEHDAKAMVAKRSSERVLN